MILVYLGFGANRLVFQCTMDEQNPSEDESRQLEVQATCHTLIGQKLCSANVSEAHWLRKVLVTCWCDTWCVISGNG
ncbi:hypothetical protein Sjap_018127 [Stephania japonica]|uniref:Uncharacterized protein n=1 Tax=Stephania japonica TaxID=461633 RepID=A0AAP0I7H2_9MAGN